MVATALCWKSTATVASDPAPVAAGRSLEFTRTFVSQFEDRGQLFLCHASSYSVGLPLRLVVISFPD